MKVRLVFAMLLILSNCTVPVAYPGEIFTGKSYFRFPDDSTWIEATRYSSWNNKPLDSPVVSSFSDSVYTGSGHIFRKRCYLTTDKGVQYMFPIPGKMKVWLNAASRFTLSFENGHFARPGLFSGHSYIESIDSLTLDLTDSLKLLIPQGAHLDIRNNVYDSTISVALIRGNAHIIGNYGIAHIAMTLRLPGRAILISKKHVSETHALIDTIQTISWRNGQKLLCGNLNLNQALQKVANWYNVKFALSDPKMKMIEAETPLSIACNEPLYSVLRDVEQVFGVNVEITRGTIYVYELYPYNRWN
jgi:hypothetical protein